MEYTIMSIKRPILISSLTFAAILTAATVTNGEETVVPDREYEIAKELGAEGPIETKGIESSVILGSISLKDDFAALDGRMLRAREVTVLPGGTVAVHQHNLRPGVLYMLEGELTEHRNDESDPLVRHRGDTSFEKAGVIHWWGNESPEKAKALVIDIVPEETG
jgi:quercetin dioxygenase-like cupin family protein